MLDVRLTVDVELWPERWDLSPMSLQRAFDRYILGRTARGDYGLPFQIARLREHDLEAVFMVETLFTCEMGLTPLAEIVSMLREGGQEVQMHLHPEWVTRSKASPLPGRKARRLSHYSLDEQRQLLGYGLDRLREAGATDIRAFRSGGYAANRDTLRALALLGIACDTSYNPCVLGEESGIARNGILMQPEVIEGVQEYPVSCFEDWPGHWRHAQLGATSFGELSSMLLAAHRAGWRSFVIVSHGFELLSPDKSRADAIAVRRFERLLRFLADHSDKFRVTGFAGLGQHETPPSQATAALRSQPLRTAWRYAEQAARRWYS